MDRILTVRGFYSKMGEKIIYKEKFSMDKNYQTPNMTVERMAEDVVRTSNLPALPGDNDVSWNGTKKSTGDF